MALNIGNEDFMIDLNFRAWMEDSTSTVGQTDDMKIAANPKLAAANSQAQLAAKNAMARKKNPLQAAQKAVLNANVPSNQLGTVLPKDPDQTDDAT